MLIVHFGLTNFDTVYVSEKNEFYKRKDKQFLFPHVVLGYNWNKKF